MPQCGKIMNENERHWVAGILEGEGCFKMSNTGPPNRRSGRPMIECNMGDEDIIRRLQLVTGVGNVQGPYSNPKHPEWTPMWRFAVQKQVDARLLMEALLPLMGQRRQEKIRAILWP